MQASLGGTPTDTSAVAADNRFMSSAMRSTDDIDRPAHSVMLSFHNVRGSDSMLNTGRIIRLFGRSDPCYALLSSIYLHFAADRKQLVPSCQAGL